MMETLALLAALVGIVLLVSYIWLAVVAFQRRLLWGFLVLLFSPITAIIFAIKYWVDAKKPFLVYIVCFTLYFSYAGFMFVHMGGPEMLDMAAIIESGQMSEDDALNFIENTMDRMGSSGMLDEQEKQDLAEMQVMFIRKGEQLAQASLTIAPMRDSALKPAPQVPQTRPYERPQMTYRDVPLSGLAKLVNMPIRVFDRQGREHNVTLLGLEDDSLMLRQNVGGGTFEFAMPNAKVARIQFLTAEPS